MSRTQSQHCAENSPPLSCNASSDVHAVHGQSKQKETQTIYDAVVLGHDHLSSIHDHATKGFRVSPFVARPGNLGG